MLVLLMGGLKLKSSKVKEFIMFIPDIMKICHSVQKLLVRDRCTDTYIDMIIVMLNLVGKVDQDLSCHLHRNVEKS
jgi:hypothetical protein